MFEGSNFGNDTSLITVTCTLPLLQDTVEAECCSPARLADGPTINPALFPCSVLPLPYTHNFRIMCVTSPFAFGSALKVRVDSLSMLILVVLSSR